MLLRHDFLGVFDFEGETDLFVGFVFYLEMFFKAELRFNANGVIVKGDNNGIFFIKFFAAWTLGDMIGVTL